MTVGRQTQEVLEVLATTDPAGRQTQLVVEVLQSVEGGGVADASAQGRKMLERPLPGAMVDYGHQYGRGLLGAWLCRDGAGTQLIDYSDYANHGVQSDMPATAWEHSPTGWCLEFAGADDIVNVAASPNLLPRTGITVAAWVYSDASQAESGIFGDWGAGPFAWLLRTAAAGDKLEFLVRVATTEFAATQAATDLSVQTWTHVVGTWGPATNSDVTMVINGGEEILIGPNTPGPIDVGGQNLKIGEAAGNPFQGRVRDLLLWDRGMTPEEAAGIYRLDLRELFN